MLSTIAKSAGSPSAGTLLQDHSHDGLACSLEVSGLQLEDPVESVFPVFEVLGTDGKAQIRSQQKQT